MSSLANLATIAVSFSSTGKLGNPWDKLIALYSTAIFDMTVKMLVLILGSLDIVYFLERLKVRKGLEFGKRKNKLYRFLKHISHISFLTLSLAC